MQYVLYFGFTDDVMFAHNRPGKGDANRTYAESDSQGVAPGRSLMSTKSLLPATLRATQGDGI